MGWIGGNVLKAPYLPKDMLDQEKLFITIGVWNGDSYIIGAESLDEGTKSILRKNPLNDDGKYFYWHYISGEESEKNVDKDIKKQGYTISSGKGVLSVSRKKAWKIIEDEIRDKWCDDGLWQ